MGTDSGWQRHHCHRWRNMLPAVQCSMQRPTSCVSGKAICNGSTGAQQSANIRWVCRGVCDCLGWQLQKLPTPQESATTTISGASGAVVQWQLLAISNSMAERYMRGCIRERTSGWMAVNFRVKVAQHAAVRSHCTSSAAAYSASLMKGSTECMGAWLGGWVSV